MRRTLVIDAVLIPFYGDKIPSSKSPQGRMVPSLCSSSDRQRLRPVPAVRRNQSCDAPQPDQSNHRNVFEILAKWWGKSGQRAMARIGGLAAETNSSTFR